MAGKMVGISFPIAAFVAIGFDHIPADMLMMPLGLRPERTQACWRCPTRTSSLPRLAKAYEQSKVGAGVEKKITEKLPHHHHQGH